MEEFSHFIKVLDGYVWGPVMMALILGTGLYLTFGLKFLPWTRLGAGFRLTWKGRTKNEGVHGELSPFQALMTALAATVGVGNIAGVATAIFTGGPGALFWMWCTAMVGMATKYAETVLAQKYREVTPAGHVVGGPMYYIKNGLGKNWKWLAVVFCIFGGLASFGIGNAVQVGNITDSVNTAIQAFIPSAADSAGTINLVLGVVLMIIVGVELLGGIKRIGSVTEKLVPFMSLIYIISCLIVLIAHASELPRVFGLIFRGAFSPEAVTGGAAGMTIKLCIEWGVKRGVFSNEAGLGSAPIAHAASSESNPVKQGLYGIFEVFMDTIVICSLSGLTILVALTEEQLNYGVSGTTSLNSQALGTVFGTKIGALLIAVGLGLFALSTVLSWGLYGTRCWEYILGTKAIKPYQVIFTLVVLVGATMDLGLAWDIADTLNGLMAIPNLIAVFALSGVVFKTTKEFFDREKALK